MTRIRMALLLGGLLALALAVGACGGGGNNSGVASLGGGGKATATTRAGGGNDRQRALAYARCMRQHGVNIPDPKPGGGIEIKGGPGVNPDSPTFKAADRACQQHQPKDGNKQEQQQSAGGGG